MSVPINVRGVITSVGRYHGWFIRVVPAGATPQHGLLILYISRIDGQEGREGYDNWVQDEDHLAHYFEYNALEVEWEKPL